MITWVKAHILAIMGATGTSMAVLLPMLENLAIWAKAVGAILGVILVLISVICKLIETRHKYLELKKLKK